MRNIAAAVGAAILLTVAILGIVRLSSHPPSAQQDWIVVSDARPRPGIAGTFGAWRLVCQTLRLDEAAAPKAAPIQNLFGDPSPQPQPSGHCAVVLQMVNRKPPYPSLNVRLQTAEPDSGDTFVTIAYRYGLADTRTVLYPPRSAGEEVDIRADRTAIPLRVRRCVRGRCVARSALEPSDFDRVLSARQITIALIPKKPDKPQMVEIPPAGLRRAMSALHQRSP
jgi:invasion protein IalB